MILDHLAVATFDDDAAAVLRRWLTDEALPRELRPAALEEEISGWFARNRIVRPGAYRLDRIVRSTRATYDDAALQSVADRIDAGVRERLNALLSDDGEGAAFTRLAADPGRVASKACLPRSPSSTFFANSGFPRIFYAAGIWTRSTASTDAPQSRLRGSCADTRSAFACRCWRSTACHARAKSWRAWSSC